LAAEYASFIQQSGTLVVFASLALVAAMAVLIGFVVRVGRGRPRTHLQGIAGTVQIVSAVLQAQAADVTNILYAWPVLSVLVGSYACLAAWRKLRFSATTIIFAVLALLLRLRGAIAPWDRDPALGLLTRSS
jgi:hypothetical protein